MSTICKLYRGLVEINKSQHYHLIDSLIHFFFFTCFHCHHRAIFSAMKHVKIVLRNKMKKEFLTDFMIIYIEWELAKDIDSNLIIN